MNDKLTSREKRAGFEFSAESGAPASGGVGGAHYAHLVRPRAMRLRSLAGRPCSSRALSQPAFVFDVAARRVTVHGRHVHLTNVEFEVLGELVRQRGVVCSRATLACAAERPAMSATMLHSTLSTLRAKLLAADARMTIRTVYGHGYVLDRT